MTRYKIDTRGDMARLIHTDGLRVRMWDMPGESERLTVSAQGIDLVVFTIEADGSVFIDVHDELKLEEDG